MRVPVPEAIGALLHFLEEKYMSKGVVWALVRNAATVIWRLRVCVCRGV